MMLCQKNGGKEQLGQWQHGENRWEFEFDSSGRKMERLQEEEMERGVGRQVGVLGYSEKQQKRLDHK